MLAISFLVALISVGLSFAVRGAWHSFEEQQFESQLSAATGRLQTQLESEIATLPKQLLPLCTHGEMVNSALTDLEAGKGQIPTDRQYALNVLSAETQKSFGFDEFVLFTNKGKVLGSSDPRRVGATEEALTRLGRSSRRASLRIEGTQPQLSAHCEKRSGPFGVGVYASKHFTGLLSEVAAAHGLQLSLSPPGGAGAVRSFELSELPGTRVFATSNRTLLDAAISELNRTILLWGSLTLAVSLALGFVFARRLARPIEQLAAQVRKEKPLTVKARGGKELRLLAESFNQAIEDLAGLRRRLAVTERVAAQREIARRVAHEIQNPLAPIRAAVETLRRLRRRGDPAFDEYFDEASQTVLDEVARITTIVKEFTEFARLPAPNPKRVDVLAVAQKVVSLNRIPGVRLEFETIGALELQADEDQLIQVLTNLLQNANEAVLGRDDAQVVLRIEQLEGDRIHIQVSDNGEGVAESVAPRLFTPYVTTKQDGTGLGLSIVQRIVIEHSGEISYARSPAGGAEFNVYLPVRGPSFILESEPG